MQKEQNEIDIQRADSETVVFFRYNSELVGVKRGMREKFPDGSFMDSNQA